MPKIPDDPLVRHVIKAAQHERKEEAVRIARDEETRKLEEGEKTWFRRLAAWFRKRGSER
jgi:hypothetical protein